MSIDVDRTTKGLLAVVSLLLAANLVATVSKTRLASAEEPVFGNPSGQREQIIAELRGLREEVVRLRAALREAPIPVEVVEKRR